MAEPLLADARKHLDETFGLVGTEQQRIGRLSIAVARILRYLEERHEAGRAPQVVPEPRQVPAHSTAEQIAALAGVVVEPQPLVTPEEAARVDVAVGEQFARAKQKTAEMAAKLDAASEQRALRDSAPAQPEVTSTDVMLDAAAERTLDLDALHALCDRATPGPWRFDDCDRMVRNELAIVVCDVDCGSQEADAADGSFIAAARDALPKLIAEVRRLRLSLQQELAELRGCDPSFGAEGDHD